VTRLQRGDPAPPFTLPDDTGADVSLEGYRGRKVVLYAYPAAMTTGCTTQACDFRDSLDSLSAAGYAVLGISPDPPEKLGQFRDAEGLTFPLLSDAGHSVLESYGAYGEKQSYGKTSVGVIRSTFVIDEEGRVEQAMYNVKANGHVAKLRKELGA
jgi:thioredoxin-dependent peroxiredoxin